MTKLRSLFLSLALLLIALPAHAAMMEDCIVADPTGTPLNARATPHERGRIVARLRNGTPVRIEAYGEGETWVRVSVMRRGRRVILGWVFHRYLDCGW